MIFNDFHGLRGDSAALPLTRDDTQFTSFQLNSTHFNLLPDQHLINL